MSNTEQVIKTEIKPLYSAAGSATIPSSYVIQQTIKR